jgi:hypothetical protein
VATREAVCNCGQLRVTVEGEPVRVSVCHCLACQRRTGSAFGAQARFKRDDAKVAGRSNEYTRVSDDGSEERIYSFCPDCGATVHYADGSSPDLMAIPLGAFADPTFPAPTVSVWESRRHDWVTLPASLKHYD